MREIFAIVGIVALAFILVTNVISIQDNTFEPLQKTEASTITFNGVKTYHADGIDDNKYDLDYNEGENCREDVQVAVYCGPGSWNDGVVAFEHFLDWKGITWEEIDHQDINQRNLSALYDALYVPGGRPDIYDSHIDGYGTQHIRELVSKGGAYIGICAGAYYAASAMHFEEWDFEFSLKLFDGTAYGPLNPIAPWDDYAMTQLSMVANHQINEYEPLVEEMLYYGGPTFYPNQGQNIDVVATYDAYYDDPAIISFQFGEGRVILIGPHPEIEEDSDRDGTDCAQELGDNGSDWRFLWTAMDFVLGNEISKPPLKNRCPDKPAKPEGPTVGKVGTSYSYTVSTTDPDRDRVYYLFDWGDGTDTGWIGHYKSGSECNAFHIWSGKGNFEIRVISMDVNGSNNLISDWSDPLSVSMPKNPPLQNWQYSYLINRIIGHFPIVKKELNIPHLFRETNEGQLIETTISAPSLANNIFDDITEQDIAIYLPPSYETSSTSYPVIYILPGFSTEYSEFLDGTFQGFNLKESMDDLINQGDIQEMIVVIPNGLTFMLGSFYVNSTVGGNWKDYIVYDLVNYIDGSYRTISNNRSRGITGHSMGGFGALNIAMLHPEVFCATYGLSPGLFDENGLMDQGMFSSDSMINEFLSKQSEWEEMDFKDAVESYKDYIEYLKSTNDYDTLFSYAYGVAFSPAPNDNPPCINYPYYIENDELLCNETVLENYENGFGGLAEKVRNYKQNLLDLKAITIDYGTNDYYSWIPRGCEYYSSILESQGISHELISFTGGHGNRVKSRIENYIFPFFSNTLSPTDENNSPTEPIINGPPSGTIGEEYEFEFISSDPNNDDVYYLIDWGDDSDMVWTSSYNSDVSVYFNHTWSVRGSYGVRAKAKDISGYESDWSEPFVISMPKGKFFRFARSFKILDLLESRYPMLNWII